MILFGNIFQTLEESKGVYNIFYQGVTIDHGKHVTGPAAQLGAESADNAACTAGMDLAHFRMLIH